jgi:hypothetical protein
MAALAATLGAVIAAAAVVGWAIGSLPDWFDDEGDL